jgi:hypothetical protein
VHFVVGHGKHSEDGVAQIRPEVKRELEKRCVCYGTVRNNRGVVWADVETIQPLPLAGEYVIAFQDLGYIGDILHLLANVQHMLRRGKWPRITYALAAPQNRTLLPPTLFKGRCSFKELQLPADVPWSTLMGWLPRSPPGCQELWPNVCTLLRPHASQTSTKRAGDSAQAQRKGAQRPACVHLCSSALLQRFLHLEGF